MHTQEQFRQLGFLEGRWVGTGPDGKPFYEQYAFTGPAELKSMRFKDERFAEQTDSSTVALQGDSIISTWGDFTWRASSIPARQGLLRSSRSAERVLLGAGVG